MFSNSNKIITRFQHKISNCFFAHLSEILFGSIR